MPVLDPCGCMFAGSDREVLHTECSYHEAETRNLKDTGQRVDDELIEAQRKLREYETWFRSNAALLATHRIGGYCFDPSPNATRVDPVHGTIIRAETTGPDSP